MNINLGTTTKWGVEREVGLSANALRRHTYLIGKTGCGKTTLLFSMLRQQIEQGGGVALMDPHGDLAERVLKVIPKNRMGDVCYFNPGDIEHPMSFNVLSGIPEKDRPVYASGLVEAFKAIWGASWGPRMEYVLYNAVSALLDCENVSLLGLQRMLVDEAYREWVVRQCKNPMVRNFWTVEFAGYDPRYAREIVSPILNKVGPFLTNPMIRNIVGQTRRSVDLRTIMDQKKILLVNLSKGKLGEIGCNLLGSLLVGMIQYTAWSRTDQPEQDRQDFTLYIDEFQNFTTDSFAGILAEARKYRLGLVLAHQYTAQLHPDVLPAIFGNVGNLLSFQIGHQDARNICQEFDGYPAGYFPEIKRYHALARIYSDTEHIEPCLLNLSQHDERTTPGRMQEILSLSNRRYTRTRKQVEAKMNRWFGKKDGMVE